MELFRSGFVIITIHRVIKTLEVSECDDERKTNGRCGLALNPGHVNTY